MQTESKAISNGATRHRVKWLIVTLVVAAEVVTFGLGVSFLIFGYPLVQSTLPASKGLTFAVYLSIGWLLANWWPHDSLHIANGLKLNGLIAIE